VKMEAHFLLLILEAILCQKLERLILKSYKQSRYAMSLLALHTMSLLHVRGWLAMGDQLKSLTIFSL
jgi:hypothetical protein